MARRKLEVSSGVVTPPTEIRRPLYWSTVYLGLRLIGGIVAFPIFVVGLVVRGLRRLTDAIVNWLA